MCDGSLGVLHGRRRRTLRCTGDEASRAWAWLPCRTPVRGSATTSPLALSKQNSSRPGNPCLPVMASFLSDALAARSSRRVLELASPALAQLLHGLRCAVVVTYFHHWQFLQFLHVLHSRYGSLASVARRCTTVLVYIQFHDPRPACIQGLQVLKLFNLFRKASYPLSSDSEPQVPQLIETAFCLCSRAELSARRRRLLFMAPKDDPF